MVLRATFRQAIDFPWTAMTPLRLGDSGPDAGAPTTFVTVERDGSPAMRIDVYEVEPTAHAFQDAIAWADFIVIGFGHHVHLASPRSLGATSIALAGYFGHFYPLEDRLLVADAERLYCLDRSGSIVWQSAPLGLDGVIVQEIDDGTIAGAGEWDPPGDWRPFRILLSSGKDALP